MSKQQFKLDFTQDDFMAGVLSALNENPEAVNDQAGKIAGGRPAAIEALIAAKSKIGAIARRGNGNKPT